MTVLTPIGAAYCGECETVAAFEERDVFAGEIFCPSCTARTESGARGTEQELLVRFPQARVYTPPAPRSTSRRQAR